MIVDYNTDAIAADAIASRVTYCRPQMQAYRTALAAATQAEVDATLLFLHSQLKATAVPVDLSGAATVRSR